MFMYLDDAEFSMRIRSFGFALRYEPRAILYHEVGPGVGFRNYSDYYLYFSVRNKPLVANEFGYRFYLYGFGFVLGITKLILYGILPGVESRSVKLRAIFWGIFDSFSSKERYRQRFPRLF
jgi:GT2 family glycosyltransferase